MPRTLRPGLVGIRDWGYSGRIQHAELEIVLRFSTKFSRPYWRLYAIVSGKSHFVIEREAEELRQTGELYFVPHLLAYSPDDLTALA